MKVKFDKINNGIAKIKDILVGTEKRSRIVLAIIITLQLIFIIFNFTVVKQGLHSDEIWSYGLANSYYEPYIFQTADENYYTHYGIWESGEVYKDYLTVNEENRFSYDSVWYNQSADLHPPLYYAVLHTICSLFLGQFSLWFGFSINLISFIIAQIFLYKTGKEIFKSRYISLLTCLFWGFCIGALDNFIFIRMYAMETAEAIILLYLHCKLYSKKDNPTYLKNMLPIVILTIMGSLTHHYFMAYAGLLSAMFCFYYLFKKQIVNMFVYAFSMISSILATYWIFPATLYHIIGRRGFVLKYPLWLQLRMCLVYAIEDVTGIEFPMFLRAPGAYILSFLIMVFIIVVPLMFVFRKEPWFLSLKDKFVICIKLLPQKIKLLPKKIKEINYMIFTSFIVAFGMIIITAQTISLPYMKSNTDRYMMLIYPMIAIVVMGIVVFICKIFKNKKNIERVIQFIVICGVLIINYTCHESNYYFEGQESLGSITEMLGDSNVIIANNEQWLITCIVPELMNCDQVFTVTTRDIFECKEEMEKIDNDKPIYLLLSVEAFYDNSMVENQVYTLGGFDVPSNVNISNEIHNEYVEVEDDEGPIMTIDLDTLEEHKDFYKSLSYFQNMEYIKEINVFGRNYSVARLK